MTTDPETNGTVKAAVRTWFRPPRAHGDIIEDRTVSFLELFYDLVFVVLVAQIAHTLAAHPTWSGIRDFAVVFGLVWIAWLNGTLYHELHGGEDGRSRTYIFIQMTMLVLMSVFTAYAADDTTDGRGFATVYAVLLAFLAWQWFDVHRQDDTAGSCLDRCWVGDHVAHSPDGSHVQLSWIVPDSASASTMNWERGAGAKPSPLAAR